MIEKERKEFANTLDENWIDWWMLQQIKRKKLDEYDANVLTTARDLAVIHFWYIIEDDSKAYPKIRKKEEGKAGRIDLWKKWTTQYNLLLHENRTSYAEVEKIIQFVIKDEYWSKKAKYSAGTIRRKFRAIKRSMYEH